MGTEHDEITFRSFTIREIADAIHNLGYRAKIVIDDDGFAFIQSASSGVHWNVSLGNNDPFLEEMHLSTLIWTDEEVYEWASNWNSCHYWSMAHVHLPDGPTEVDVGISRDPIMVASSCRFTGGVSHHYLEETISRWIETIDELCNTEGVETLSPKRLEEI